MFGNPYKTDVKVIAEFDKFGKITPLSIHWVDGRVYPIDKIIKMQRAASTKAGVGIYRYDIQIGQVRTFLFLDHDFRWFVETKM